MKKGILLFLLSVVFGYPDYVYGQVEEQPNTPYLDFEKAILPLKQAKEGEEIVVSFKVYNPMIDYVMLSKAYFLDNKSVTLRFEKVFLKSYDTTELFFTFIIPKGTKINALKDSFVMEFISPTYKIKHALYTDLRIKPSSYPKQAELIFLNTSAFLDKPEPFSVYDCNFIYQNTGDVPLTIASVQSSNNELIHIAYPNEPIEKGKTGFIKAQYQVKFQAKIREYITVRFNDYEDEIQLIIKGTMR